jgi:hypothetical protein
MQPGFNTTLLHLATTHYSTVHASHCSLPISPGDAKAAFQLK